MSWKPAKCNHPSLQKSRPFLGKERRGHWEDGLFPCPALGTEVRQGALCPECGGWAWSGKPAAVGTGVGHPTPLLIPRPGPPMLFQESLAQLFHHVNLTPQLPALLLHVFSQEGERLKQRSTMCPPPRSLWLHCWEIAPREERPRAQESLFGRSHTRWQDQHSQ
uniref:Uncharacterized protein n=1 Tax=Pipistrellus kuhlii TaxID=59472 RepID=A0A7J8B1C4_PIPKU|nr:hypothetical protein mPipKuh1_007717 [Pipistrellus kuhlii]